MTSSPPLGQGLTISQAASVMLIQPRSVRALRDRAEARILNVIERSGGAADWEVVRSIVS